MDSFVAFLIGESTSIDIYFICRFFVFIIVLEGIVSITHSLANSGKGR